MAGGGNAKGVTLVELVATMAVFSIVLSIAAYSFKDVLWRNQVNTAANEMVTALSFARSEAVTRGQTVAVCRSSDVTLADNPGRPVPSCTKASGIGWETGYIVFVDGDGNGSRNADEDLLRVFSGASGGVTISGGGNVKDVVLYLATGFFPAGVSNDTVTIKNDNKTVEIKVSKNGRVRVE